MRTAPRPGDRLGRGSGRGQHDLEAAEARVLAAGATKYDFQPNDDHCYVYADPAGHPFCLSTWDDVQS
jgi:hypothetical protein